MTLLSYPANAYLRRSYLLVFLACSFFTSLAQTKPSLQVQKTTSGSSIPEVVQSPYYDAIELLYILKGYTAYPVIVPNTGNAVTVRTLNNPPSTGGSPTKIVSNGGTPAQPSGKNSATPKAPTGHNPPPSTQKTDSANAKKDTTTSEHTVNLLTYTVLEAETGKVLLGPTTDTNAVKNTIWSHPIGDNLDSFLIQIMRRNTPNGASLDTDTLMKLAYQNKFLFPGTGEQFIPQFVHDSTKAPLSEQDLLNTGSLAAPNTNIGGAAFGLGNTTTIATGIAQFLINRVDKEFQNSFINTLIDYIEKKAPELQILFPKTLASLKIFKASNYKSSFTAVQNACQSDISGLIGHLSGLTVRPWCQNLMKRYPPLVLLFTSCDVVDMLNQNIVLPEIIYRVGKASYLDYDTSKQYSSFIKLVSLLSNSVRDIQFRTPIKDKQQWIDTSRINYLVRNQPFFQAFLALVAQNSQGIQFGNGKETLNFYTAMMNQEETLVKDNSIIYNLSQQILNANSVVNSFANTLKNMPQLTDYLSAFGGIATYLVDLSQTGIELFPTTPTINDISKVLQDIKGTYLPMVNNLDSIAYNISQKEYSTALNQGIKLFKDVVAQIPVQKVVSPTAPATTTNQPAATPVQPPTARSSGPTIDTTMKKTGDTTAEGLTATVGKSGTDNKVKPGGKRKKNNSPADPVAKSATDTINSFISFMENIGQFIGAVAEAKTSQDVSDALNSFALPPGSSRDLKENGVTLGLNAYVNVYHSWNTHYANTKIPATETGISAPIGIAFSVGLAHGKAGAISAFAGILDVGAIFTYEATDTTGIKSTIQLGQILSPSFSIIYDIPLIGKNKVNIPLEIGASAQWGPRLKNVTEQGNTTLPLMTFRWNVFVGLDIPVIHFLGHKRT